MTKQQTYHEGPTFWRHYSDRNMPVAVEFCQHGHILRSVGIERRTFTDTGLIRSRIARCDGAL